MNDMIERQVAIDAIRKEYGGIKNANMDGDFLADEIEFILSKIPSAQPTLYGYNIEHLALIARVMQKENVTPEKAIECFEDLEKMFKIIIEEQKELIMKEMKLL